VSIGYSGLAYLGAQPTDHWIVRTIAGDPEIFNRDGLPAIFGRKRLNRLRLHQICNRLRLGLGAEPYGNRVVIQIAGWRMRRRKVIPVSLKLRGQSKLGPDPTMNMRLRVPIGPLFSHTGAQMSTHELNAACQKFGLPKVPMDEQRTREFLSTIIRDKAIIDRTVGRDVMSVMILCPSSKKAICHFDPEAATYGVQEVEGQSARLLTSYTPWVLTPNHFKAPSETTGDLDSSESLHLDEWNFDFTSTCRADPTPSNIGWIKPQERRPAPGRSRIATSSPGKAAPDED
jgi:hypothetical protein